MFNTFNTGDPVKKGITPTNPVTPANPGSAIKAASPYSPAIGKIFGANTASGNRQVIFNDAASGRTVIKNPKTGQYELYPYRKVQAAMERGVELTGGKPMNGQQANYFMDASQSLDRHYEPGAGEGMGQAAKQTNRRSLRQPGAYHNDGTVAMTLRREGGILYKK